MKEKVQSLIKSLFVAYALTTDFQFPLLRENYEDTMSFLAGNIYEFFGTYDFTFLLIGILGYIFFEKIRTEKSDGSIWINGVAAFFSACILIGNSFYETNSWVYCFGSLVNFGKTILAFVGYYCLFRACILLLFQLFDKGKIVSENKHFFRKNAFWKAFGILGGVYLFVLILSFPGNLCWDVIGQIEQVTIENAAYTQHHPLMHTLLVGGLTQLGEAVFGSKEIGLFLYMLIQNAMFVSALAAVITVLAKRNIRKEILWGLLVLFCISPVYTNLASTAIKDIPFVSFVIGYIICYSMWLENPQCMRKPKFITVFLLIQMGAVLCRNNGLYLVVFSGLAAVLFLWKKCNWKERLSGFVFGVMAGALIAKLLVSIVAAGLGAKAGGKAEMFSLPMQQTARYLVYYESELTPAEREGIEGVFPGTEQVAQQYDPDIADPVKALFDNNASMEAVIGYFKAWGIGLCRHPLVYMEAFLNHVYGWFTPSVNNALRYETQYDAIGQGMLFPYAQNVVLLIYRVLDRISVLGLLQNVGIYVWGTCLISVYAIKKNRKVMLFSMTPLWVSLLICMASPCFFLHPRYALPIMLGFPYILVWSLSANAKQEKGQ